jgi:hypothetical protein
MKKAKTASEELRTEYNRSDFKELERGKYYERVTASSNVVVLDPEIAAIFPNSVAVNRALHSLVETARNATAETATSRRSALSSRRSGKNDG